MRLQPEEAGLRTPPRHELAREAPCAEGPAIALGDLVAILRELPSWLARAWLRAAEMVGELVSAREAVLLELGCAGARRCALGSA